MFFENLKKYHNIKNQRKMCPHNIARKLHAKFGEAGACGCRDMMYPCWPSARQKLSVIWKVIKKSKLKNPRKTCPDNIVNTKFRETRANGSREDMMYLNWASADQEVSVFLDNLGN